MTKENTQPVIRCQNVYKIFGRSASEIKSMSGGKVDQECLKNYGLVAAVNDVSLDVYPGEMLVVMGLSGSGKSTLIRCMSRLIETTSGSIEIEGQNLLSMSDKELIELRRHKMGMVFQNFALLPHKTVLENIAFPLQMRGMNKADYVKRAKAMIELVSLHGRENDFPRQLSGGQQQRVGIARSLAVEPDIWFLDEPFSALDPLIRKEMQNEFLRLQSILHKTIVFITHDFDEALRLADRVAIMFHGRVEQCDTPENIVLNPASDYVRKFTTDVPREKVLTAGSLMDEKRPGDIPAPKSVNHSDRIEDIAKYVLSQERPVMVHDEDFNPVGMLHRDKVLNTLYPDNRTEV
ncbi:MAG: ATP-binding cassette domain-containing protein [Gammaproteobacteria bacterium]|nr:ATP-binding cassette domain-containing protein [Gammaproteobacteria bacterium]